MPDKPNPDPQRLGVCSAHGLRYDPTRHSGCVVCRREAEVVVAAPRARPVWTRTTLLVLGLVLAALLALALVRDLATGARGLAESARVSGRALPPAPPLRVSNAGVATPSAAPNVAPASPDTAEPSPCTRSARGLDAVRDAAPPVASELHRAAARGDVAGLLQHIELGASVDERDGLGRTALAWAAATGQTEAARVMLERHANPNLAANDDVMPLMLAAASGAPQLVELLLAHDARLEAVDQRARTALMLAARANHADVVSLLIRHGAAIETRCERGMTALHYAAEGSPCIDALARLLAASASVDARDMSGTTPLMLAAHAGFTDVVSVLLEHGARGDVHDNRGFGPVDYVIMPRDDMSGALHENLFAVLQMLIDHDPDPQLGQDAARTPILFRAQLEDWARSRGGPGLPAYAPTDVRAHPAGHSDDAQGSALLLHEVVRQSSRAFPNWLYQDATFTIRGMMARAPNIVQQVRISGLALGSGQQVTLSGDAAGKEGWGVDGILLIERYQGYQRVSSAFVSHADAVTLAEQPVRRLGTQAWRHARGAIDFSPWLATGTGADHVLVSVLDFGGVAASTDVFLQVQGAHAASTARGAKIETLHAN